MPKHAVLLGAALLLSAQSNALEWDVFAAERDVSTTPVTAAMQSTAHRAVSCQFDPKILPATITLIEVVERTLCHNPQTLQAWSVVKGQAAQVGLATASYLPTVSASYSYTEGSSNYQVKNYPELSYDTDLKSHDMSMNLSWVLFDFGLRRSRLAQEKFALSAAYASQNATLHTVFLSAAQAYYELVRIKGVLLASREAEQAALQSAKAAVARYKAGVGTLADQLQAQTNQAKAISERIKAQGELQSAKGELASLMGAPVNAVYQVESIAPTSGTNEFLLSIDALLAKAQQVHPELLAANAQVKAAQAALNATKKEGLPTISLSSTLGENQQLGTPPANTNTNSFNWGVSVNMPLFEGFGRHYRVRAAQAELDTKYAELAQVQQRVSLTVWKSYYALSTEAENMKAIELLQGSAKQSYEVALGRYKAGVGSMLELLNAQTVLADAQQQHNAAVAAWQTARVQLFASLGQLGLWQALLSGK